MPNEFKIVDLQDVPAIDPARKGKMDKLVKYELGDGRRRYVRLPSEGSSEQRIVDAVRRDLAELKAIVGKSFPH